MREVSVIMGSELIEMFKTMRRLGMPPMQSRKMRNGMGTADIVGIGDNGAEVVRRLMESDCANAIYLVLHRDEKKLRQMKADTIAMKDDSWEVVENVMTASFESLPISYQEFCFYYRQTWRFWYPSLVLADFSEAIGRETAPAAAKDSVYGSTQKIAVVHVPLLEKLMDKNETEMRETELYQRFQCLCEHAEAVIAMGDDASAALGTAAANAMAKRQSDFVGDLLLALHGDEEMRLSWQEVRAFLSAGRRPRWGNNLWQAWSSEAADVRSAMADVQRVLSCGGALQAAKRVFVMVTGKEGELPLPAVQETMVELSALLDKEAEVLLHVNSETEFDAGVRINMAVQVEREC